MKRKGLNQRQLQRIRKRQDSFAARAEDGHRLRDEAGDDSLGPEERGIVISQYGRQLEVEALEGEKRGHRFRCHHRANLEALVTGDRVIWREGEPLGVVVALSPRASLLRRPGPSGEPRPVAANIDQLVVVIAPQPQPFPNLIDRYLVAAEAIPLSPLLVLNKVDLMDDGERAELDDLLGLYAGIGYRTLRVSSKSGAGLDALTAALNGRTSIFVGQSGVGKSALVNALLPGVDTLVGSLSEAEAKGRHTTTTARLFHFPGGGDLIDSPGIREFGLGHLEPDDLLHGFVEFRPFLGHCRFRDCRHEREPGCRLLEAAEKGEIDPRRMASYRQILQSLANGN